MFSPNSFTSNPKTPEEDVFTGLLSTPLSFALKLPGRGTSGVAVALLIHQHPDTFMTASILW